MKNLLQLTLVLLCLVVTNKTIAQQDKTMYIFGHSLIVHDPPTIPTPSDETSVPHWLHFLAENAGSSIGVSGQYGFLPNHEDRTANETVRAQWNFDHVAQAWNSDNEDFSEVDFDVILITAANFIQYKPSNQNYDGPNSHTSPLASILNILDWAKAEEPNAVQYIYENWPNMNGLVLTEDGEFPPSEAEFENYHEIALGSFHDWWIDYHDFIQSARPNDNIKMIPVGPIISKLLTETPLNAITAETLYEDDSPHGRPTIYFLAALITYMAIYEEKLPATYIIPTSDTVNPVSPVVQANYQGTIDFIWNELLAFNYSNGQSRVFANNPLNVDYSNENVLVDIFPNPSEGVVNFSVLTSLINIEVYNTNGEKVIKKNKFSNSSLDISELSNGLYFIKLEDENYNTTIKKLIKK
ncbi:T9SS type A sorting domain-containing protein [uncultured Algibacter sp.]|uniref:T9SS type A sorting domain-containing protein n=1 Tax=uncultured Algibacter sp. TaxID=298659 RepID=UPI0026036DD9|nr:T9SS type A sorting domain-containing protein [uncultured Algibacter sp.]